MNESQYDETRQRGDAVTEDMGRGGFFGQSVARPIGLGVAFITLIVVGIISYNRIPLQLLPTGFAAPQLNIWVNHPGSSARENEEKVARPIEEQLRTLAGIDRVRSNSSEGVWMRVYFDASIDLDLAKAEVRDRLERARPLLPDTVGEIEFWSEDADQFPISFFGILHEGDSDRTDFLLDAVVKPRLEAVSGVSKIDVFGVLNDSVRILLDEDRVVANGLDIGALIGRLASDNFAQPLGEIDDGGQRFILRSDMRFTTPEEVERYPIGNGLVIGDVGRVIRAKSVRDELSRIDGDYAYYGVARKESQAEVVESSRELLAAFTELEEDPRLEGRISFMPFFMQGKLIENSLSQLRNTALWGGALALLVLFVFLRRVRLTLCVALAIPVSALMAIAFEYFGGGSFNLLTMVGITLGIGMLVDNAVVVIENIARHRALGLDGQRAAVAGAREIALAVTLATLTSVVVFMPLIFMASNPEARMIFGGIGMPLCVSLLFSLLVAVVFLPVVSARILGERPTWMVRGLAKLDPIVRIPAYLVSLVRGALRLARFALVWPLSRVTRGVLAILAPRAKWARWPAFAARAAGAGALVWVALQLAERISVASELTEPIGLGSGDAGVQGFVVPAAIAGLALLFGLPLLAGRRRSAPRLESPLFPPARAPLDVVVDTHRNVVSWALAHRSLACVVAVLCFASIAMPLSNLDMAAFGTDGENGSVRYRVRFDTNYTLSEASDQIRIHENFLAGAREELGFDHWSVNFDDRGGRLSLYWDEAIKPSERKRSQQWVKDNAPRPAGHRLRFADSENAGERSRTIARFELRGPDSEVLEEYGVQAAKLLENVAGLSNIETPIENAPEQVEVEIDREVAYGLGVDSQTALQNIGWTLRGFPLPRFQDDGREIPFVIEYDTETIAGMSSLRDMRVWTGESAVSLASFSELKFRQAPTTIRRDNGRTTFELTAEVADPTRTTELTEAGYRALAGLDLPRGYELGLDNSARARANDEAAAMMRAMLLSIVLVFLLMGILFESIVLPFSVLVTIPFAVMGAFWTLWLVGTPMDLLGWIGLIILAGVVVNNGIVLIDCIHRLRRDGDSRAERDAAVVEGAGRRVRPILMTALTTVFGLIPMILTEPTDDSIDYRALGTIVAGGLAVSTLFTLWVVPLAYTLIDDFAQSLSTSARWALTRGAMTRRTAAPEQPAGAELSGGL